MTTQLAPFGATVMINKISGNSKTSVGASAPATWIPGQEWYNTGTSTLMAYPGAVPYSTGAWVASSSMNLYLALLTADPGTSGSGGGLATFVADLVEDATAGYARQVVTFSSVPEGSEAWPATTSNTGNLTFGPYTANQSLSVQWCALISSNSATGTVGNLLYYWSLVQPQQVQISQSIIIAAGSLQWSEQ